MRVKSFHFHLVSIITLVFSSWLDYFPMKLKEMRVRYVLVLAFSSSLFAPSLYWYHTTPLGGTINNHTYQYTAQCYASLGTCVYLQGCKELQPDPRLSAGTHGSDGHSGVLLLPRAQAGRWGRGRPALAMFDCVHSMLSLLHGS